MKGNGPPIQTFSENRIGGQIPLCGRPMARYVQAMTKLLDRTVAAARNLPPAVQDEIARVVLSLAGTGDEASPVTLSSDGRAAIARSKAGASRGAFAPEEQVRAVWAKHGL
ncbi:MAG TPA: hypothetical protein VMU82_07705 [Acetobacteraceae bacterium]|nr:hypothetical protein [Acetobacteraceae bacterium]